MKKVLLTLSLLLISIAGAKAQNLWDANPGFEDVEDYYGSKKLTRWAFGLNAIQEDNFSTDSHEGIRALKIYPTDKKSLSIIDLNEDDPWIQTFPCKVGDTFLLSYWHKGNLDINTLEVTINLYDKDSKYTPIGTKVIHGSSVITQENWTKKEIKITIQQGDIPMDKVITSFDIRLMTSFKFNSNQYIIIDDFNLVKDDNSSLEMIKAPSIEKTSTYEHELEWTWSGDNDDQVSWEVSIDEADPVACNQTSYIMTNLNPNEKHRLKVRAVKGNIKSEYSKEKELMTRQMAKDKDDIDRAPRIRTIAPDGSVHKQQIELFYYDLYNVQNAKITYIINGQQISPNGYILPLPKTGLQTLEIRIEEDAEHIWNLVYHLNVFN